MTRPVAKVNANHKVELGEYLEVLLTFLSFTNRVKLLEQEGWLGLLRQLLLDDYNFAIISHA